MSSIQDFIRSKLNEFQNNVASNIQKITAPRIQNAPFVGGLVGQVVQRFQQPTQVVSPQLKPVFPQIKPAIQNYIQNRQQYFQQNPLTKVFDPNQFRPENIGRELSQADYNMRTKLLGFGPNLEAPLLPPTFGGAGAGLEMALQKSPMLTRAGNAVLGQVGKIKLGPTIGNTIKLFTRLISQRELDIFKKTGKLPANKEGYVNIINPGETPLKIGGNKIHVVTFKPEIEKLIESKATGQSAIKGEIPKTYIQSIKVKPSQPLAGEAGGIYRIIKQEGISDLTKKTQLGYQGVEQGKIALKVSPQKVKIQGVQQPTSPLLTKSSTLKTSIPQMEEDQFIQGLKRNTPPNIDVSAETAQRAETIGAISGGKVGNLDDSTRNAFQDWVNSRRATQTEALLKKKEFQDLDSKGIQGIFEFQAKNAAGIENPRYKDVTKYFDTKYAERAKTGVNFGYKEDYLPQIWNNSQDEIQKVFGRGFTTKPSFSLSSMIQDYKAGIESGLKPKFQNISQLVGWYEGRFNKAVADFGFFNHMRNDGIIMPSSKTPFGWKTIEPDRFPKYKTNLGNNQTYQGTYSAPPELADMINNYLKDPNGKLQAIAGFVSSAKNRLLSFGIPKTAINFHGFNILARHTLFGTGGNPITRLITGVKYMISPRSAESYLNKELVKAPQAIKNGLTVTAEDHTALSNEVQTFLTSFGKKWNQVFEVPLFNKMLPALKLSSYENLVKNGMEGRDAAKMVNNVYGGINWEQMGRNKDMQNLFRTIALTPDWLESTGRLGGNLVKSFTQGGPVAARYRTMMATFLWSVVTLNIANKMSSGHYAYENDPGHAFELEIGYTQDGQKRYWRPYGTATDFVRLPVDIAIGVSKGDLSVLWRTLRNRVSPPVGALIGALTDTDYRGQPIGWTGKTKYGQDMPTGQRIGGIAGEIGSAVGFPSFLKQGIDTITGKQGLEQGILQGMELPVRYSGGAYSKTQKDLLAIAKEQQGIYGKDIYDFNKKTQGQAPFSQNQLSAIKQTGLGTLDTIMTNRQGSQQETEAKKAVEAGAGQQIANGKLFYTDSNGDIKSVQLNRQITEPKLTGQTELDKKLISTYNSSITAKINDITELYKLNKLTAEQANTQIADLKKIQSKFAKPKKLKKLTVSKISAKRVGKIKVSKPKKVKMLKFKTTKLKLAKLSKYKIAKAK